MMVLKKKSYCHNTAVKLFLIFTLAVWQSVLSVLLKGKTRMCVCGYYRLGLSM